MFSPDLVDKVVTFAAAAAAGRCFCWSRCPFDVISDSGRYIEISFSVSTVNFEKDTSLIACSRVCLVGQKHQPEAEEAANVTPSSTTVGKNTSEALLQLFYPTKKIRT